MKKSLLLGMFSLVAGAATSFGQGYIALDNYASNGSATGPGFVNYGAAVRVNGISGTLGTVGTGLGTGWTAGLYFVVGTPVISDPAGSGMPNAGLGLASGPGSTVAFYDTSFSTVGTFSPGLPLNISASGTPTITAEVVAYDTAGGSYLNAQFRGHSAPFNMPSVGSLATAKPLVGDYFTTFQVLPVPEPSTLALAGLGGLSLLLMRRKKA